MATIGVDYGIPGQVATRMAYGVLSAKWVPSLLRLRAPRGWPGLAHGCPAMT